MAYCCNLYNQTVLHSHKERAPFLDLLAYAKIAFRLSAAKPVSQETYFGAKEAEGVKERGECVDIDESRITARIFSIPSQKKKAKIKQQQEEVGMTVWFEIRASYLIPWGRWDSLSGGWQGKESKDEEDKVVEMVRQ